MFRRSLVTLAVLTGVGAAGCGAAKARPISTQDRPPRELALEVIQTGMSKELYQSLIALLSQSMQNGMEKMAAAEGRTLPPDTSRIVAEIVGQEMPYETVTSLMADIYLRHFSPAELEQLAAIRRMPVSQKFAGLMVEMGTEVQQQAVQVLVARRDDIRAKVNARLGAANPQTR